eukprot:2933013-Pleurochrysis_carterae.AAC.1
MLTLSASRTTEVLFRPLHPRPRGRCASFQVQLIAHAAVPLEGLFSGGGGGEATSSLEGTPGPPRCLPASSYLPRTVLHAVCLALCFTLPASH